jgi:hypothetical protein
MLLLLLLIAAAVWFYPAPPDSGFHRLQLQVRSMGDSHEQEREELRGKKLELAEYERVIGEITAEDARMVENAPICPINGQKALTTMTQDPRPELRAKCDTLREEIRALEAKIGS